MYFGIDEKYSPALLQAFEKESKAAWDRIVNVMNSEASAVDFELRNGIELGWDGTGSFPILLSNDSSSFSSEQLYQYPGKRILCKNFLKHIKMSFPYCNYIICINR
jgi:hypothetical protein